MRHERRWFYVLMMYSYCICDPQAHLRFGRLWSMFTMQLVLLQVYPFNDNSWLPRRVIDSKCKHGLGISRALLFIWSNLVLTSAIRTRYLYSQWDFPFCTTLSSSTLMSALPSCSPWTMLLHAFWMRKYTKLVTWTLQSNGSYRRRQGWLWCMEHCRGWCHMLFCDGKGHFKSDCPEKQAWEQLKKKLKGEVVAAAFCDSDFEDDVVFWFFWRQVQFCGGSFWGFVSLLFFHFIMCLQGCVGITSRSCSWRQCLPCSLFSPLLFHSFMWQHVLQITLHI